MEGVPEADILQIKQEKIDEETMESIRIHGWLPDLFRQIIRAARDFLQELIFKFTLPPKSIPQIDLQEWKDMQKLMEKLQKQTREIKQTQQNISSLKKQLLETKRLFKGKERKALEGKKKQAEQAAKQMNRNLEQMVKKDGYLDVQSFVKVYNRSKELVKEYEEELREWKNQTKPEQEKPKEKLRKESVLEKLHRYQQEGKQLPPQSIKRTYRGIE